MTFGYQTVAVSGNLSLTDQFSVPRGCNVRFPGTQYHRLAQYPTARQCVCSPLCEPLLDDGVAHLVEQHGHVLVGLEVGLQLARLSVGQPLVLVHLQRSEGYNGSATTDA